MAGPPYRDVTVGALLTRLADDLPDREALVYPDRRLTFAMLETEARVTARGLLACGVGPGDRVALWATNVPEWVVLQFALAKIGAILVTVNTALRARELDYVLRQSGTTTLVTLRGVKDGEYLEILRELGVLTDRLCEPTAPIPGGPRLARVILIGGEPREGCGSLTPYATLRARAAEVETGALAACERAVGVDAVITMQYTSGTTGFPKGVMLSSRNIVDNGYWLAEGLGLDAGDRLCLCVPLFHCFGCVIGVLGAYTHGACLCPVERFVPRRVLETVERERCTALYGVPTMFLAELEEPGFPRRDLTSLRTGVMAGALCPQSLMRRVIDEMHLPELTIVYGLTEASPGITQTARDDPLERRIRTVGRVMPDMEVRIVDPASGRPAGAGEPGELQVRGYNVMKGYYHDADATRAAIDADGWLRTGDQATIDADGYVRVTGRIKDLIIRAGENIDPSEVEACLREHPAVADAYVYGVASERFGEEVAAAVRVRPGATITAGEIEASCSGRIAGFKIPRAIRFVTEFPMTASGKVQKFKLREIHEAERATRHRAARPMSSPPYRDLTVGALLTRLADDLPDREALVYPDRRLTFAMLETEARVIARGLLACGVGPGDRVALWAANVPEWIVLQFALAKIGAILVTVNTALRPRELDYVLRQSGTTTLVACHDVQETGALPILSGIGALPERPVPSPAVRSPRAIRLNRIIIIGGDRPDRSPGVIPYADLRSRAARVDEAALDARQDAVYVDAVITMQYTSGTTGAPKGVMLSSRNIVNNGHAQGRGLDCGPEDRVCLCVPLFHCFGCVVGVLGAFTHGACLCPVERFAPRAVLETIARERCTIVHGVPTMFLAMLEDPDRGRFDLGSLRTGIMAGAPCPELLMRRVIDEMHLPHMTIAYGLTEASPGVTLSAHDDSIAHRTQTVGCAIPEIAIRVVDPSTDAPVGPGVRGELEVRGDNVMKGYYNDPDATRAAIDSAGWLRTGDQATIDADGYVRVTGRIKDLIIRGGENVDPAEVEACLRGHPAVADAYVYGVSSERFGEEVAAAVRLEPGATATVEALGAACAGELAPFKIPRAIRFVTAFPLTASGKVQKFKLRAMHERERAGAPD